VLYGQTGPGGIVNVVTKRPTAEQLRELELSAGSFGNKQAAFDWGGPMGADGQWSYRLTGLVRDSDTQTDFVKNDRRYIAPALTWRPAAGTTLTLLAHHQKDSQGAAVNNSLPRIGTLSPNPNGQIPINRYPGEPAFDKFEKTQSSIGYLLDHRLDETWTYKQNLRYSDVESDYANAYADGLGADQRTVDRFTYTPRDAAKTWRLDNHMQAVWTQGKFDHTVLFGLDYQRTRYAFKAGFGTAPPIDIYTPVYGAPVADPALYEDSQTHASQIGLYWQNQIKFDRRWVFLLGGRWDRAKIDKSDSIGSSSTQQSDSEVTWRTGVVHLFDSGLAPYASYSTSFEPAIGTNAAGNSFTPTAGKQAELGLRYQPEGSRDLFSVALFELTQRNVLTTDPANPAFRIQTGEVRSRGIELEGKFAITQVLNLTASYTHLDARITKSNDGVEGNRRGRVPQDVATLWADYTVRSGGLRGLGVGAGARFTGKTPVADTNVHSLPARTLVDAMLRYDWDQYTASLNATNLLNKKYVGVCYNDGYGFCGYGPARNIVATLRYRW
jgi:iron complex outermembrane receptor protein